MEKTANKSLKEISDFFEIDDQTIADYNVWLRKGRIPTDKTYFAIIPVTTNDYVAQNLLGVGENVKAVDPPKSKIVFVNDYKPISEFNFNENEEFPKVNNNSPTKVKINGIPGFIAKSTDDINSISVGHGISINKFLKNNDMTASDKIIPGRVYYLKTKKSKAKIHYHVVIPGENAWSISQKYGLRVRKLLTKNRMKEEKDLGPGMVMWLRFIRPSDVPVEYKESVAQNVIVKSIPNEIEYPQSNYTPIEQGSSNENLSSEALVLENEREDFLFEEISDDTEFISEKSYVDLKEEEKNIEKQTTDNLSQKEIKNVKKVEFYHIVKSGETLFSISRTYEISIGELRQWNNFDNLDVLSVGQQLLIKSHSKPMIETQSSKSSNNYKSYKVKADDTLYGIARKYNISIKELMEINNKDDFNIKEGEVIKIKL